MQEPRVLENTDKYRWLRDEDVSGKMEDVFEIPNNT
jgi:hypothetical protein